MLWSELAEQQLLEKIDYILQSSQSIYIAEKFHREIYELTEKLAYFASAYNDGCFHIYTVESWHSVKFIVDGDIVYIAEFIAKGREYII